MSDKNQSSNKEVKTDVSMNKHSNSKIWRVNINQIVRDKEPESLKKKNIDYKCDSLKNENKTEKYILKLEDEMSQLIHEINGYYSPFKARRIMDEFIDLFDVMNKIISLNKINISCDAIERPKEIISLLDVSMNTIKDMNKDNIAEKISELQCYLYSLMIQFGITRSRIYNNSIHKKYLRGKFSKNFFLEYIEISEDNKTFNSYKRKYKNSMTLLSTLS